MFLRLDCSGSCCWRYQCGGCGGSGGRGGGCDCGSVGGVGFNELVSCELNEIIITSLDYMIYQKHLTVGFITPLAMFYLWFNY